MKNASGAVVTGMLMEPGIVPVLLSSEGSRVSMRTTSDEGDSDSRFTWGFVS